MLANLSHFDGGIYRTYVKILSGFPCRDPDHCHMNWLFASHECKRDFGIPLRLVKRQGAPRTELH